MKRNQHLPEQLVAYASVRGGIFTTTAAERHGVRTLGRAVRNGECHKVRQGLYSLTEDLDIRSRIWAGLIMAGPASVVGGEAAEHLLGQGPEPAFVDIWTGHRQLSDRGCWRFHRGVPTDVRVEKSEFDKVFGRLAVIAPPDRELAARMAGDCLHLADRERFLALCEESDSTRSAFEARFHREVAGPHGLPELSWSRVPDGPGHQLRARVSGLDPRIIFDGSLRRPEAGWPFADVEAGRLGPDEPLVISWSDVSQAPCETSTKVTRRLRSQGWQGDPLHCGRCRVSASRSSVLGPASRRSADCPTCGAQLVALWRDRHWGVA